MSLTERIARACAMHPGRTLTAWAAALVASVLALLFLMTGLTTEPTLTNDPESDRAADLIGRSFPPDPQRFVTDLVVVRSDELTVDDPRFRTFVENLVRETRASGAVVGGRTYYDAEDRSLVSSDRHATLAPIAIRSEDDAGGVIEIVERANADPSFAVAVTGNQTLDHDFNLLSERDLQEGELQFG